MEDTSSRKGKRAENLAPKKGDTGKVKLIFSCAGMDASLGSLDGLSTETSAHGGNYMFGSNKDNSNMAFKDITSKANNRPKNTKHPKLIAKLNGKKRPAECVGPNGRLGPLFKMPQFNFNFGPTVPTEGPNHSRRPNLMACDKPKEPNASPIPIGSPEGEGTQTDLGKQEIRAQEEDETTMEDRPAMTAKKKSRRPHTCVHVDGHINSLLEQPWS